MISDFRFQIVDLCPQVPQAPIPLKPQFLNEISPGYRAATAASNMFKNSSFFSAGRKAASKELRASSRR